MRFYQVTFEGVGFDIYLDYSEKYQKVGGFFVSVVVSAAKPEEAFEVAYQKLINSKAYQDLYDGQDHPNAVIAVCEYCELTHVDSNVSEISGIVFYPPDDHVEDGGVTNH